MLLMAFVKFVPVVNAVLQMSHDDDLGHLVLQCLFLTEIIPALFIDTSTINIGSHNSRAVKTNFTLLPRSQNK